MGDKRFGQINFMQYEKRDVYVMRDEWWDRKERLERFLSLTLSELFH